MTLEDYIKGNEGCRLRVYLDTVGKATIGYGRNLDAEGISQAEADFLFANDLGRATNAAIAVYGSGPWSTLGSVRRAALIDMAFELGEAGLAGFRHTLAALRASDWQSAHDGVLASDYAREVPTRAARTAYIFLTGEWPGSQG